MREHTPADTPLADASPEDAAMSRWVDQTSIYVRLSDDEASDEKPRGQLELVVGSW
jgi:hypothetical protein